jgi:Mlc titration factor MtfA (ptsG expression regulator)
MWRGPGRKKLRSTPLPPEWRRIIEARCPFYHRLPDLDRRELAGHVQVFMAEKLFEGCGGLKLTDEIRIGIAAHACLLLLHRDTDYYPALKTILVYPGTYAALITRHVGSGIMEEGHQFRAGESWREGAVVLAWDAVRSGMLADNEGSNVVWHEFAHQLDFEDGRADGVPLLGRGEPRSVRQRRYATWSQVMLKEYEQLQAQIKRGEETVLRPYGATNAAEFFAVATECFFGRPQALQPRHPELYEEMKWYYQQDPAGWPPQAQLIPPGP